MNKEEILQKSRDENRKGDERDQLLKIKSWEMGHNGLIIMIVIIGLIRVLVKNELFISTEMLIGMFAFDFFRNGYLSINTTQGKYTLYAFGNLFGLVLLVVALVMD